MQQGTQVAVPELLALQVVGHHAGRTEGGVDGLAVGDGRAGTGRVVRVRGFLDGTGQVLLPELLAVGAGEAQDGAALALIERLSEKDVVAPDYRGRVTR